MFVIIPFIIIAFMAWGTAEELLADSVVWRVIFDIIGAAAIALGVVVLHVCMK